MRKNLFIIFIATIFSGCFLFINLAFAISFENPLNFDTFDELIDGLVDFIFWVGIVIAPLMIIIGGFFLVTAAGNPQRVATGKKIIIYTIVGLAIILLAKGLVSVIQKIIGA